MPLHSELPQESGFYLVDSATSEKYHCIAFFNTHTGLWKAKRSTKAASSSAGTVATKYKWYCKLSSSIGLYKLFKWSDGLAMPICVGFVDDDGDNVFYVVADVPNAQNLTHLTNLVAPILKKKKYIWEIKRNKLHRNKDEESSPVPQES